METKKIIIILPIINYIIFLSLISKIINLSWYDSLGYAITATLLEIFIFKKWLWKIPILQKITKINNIQGIWTGKIVSNYDDKEHIIEEVIIKQSFNKYKVVLSTKESRSYSGINEISINEFDRMELQYMYKNEAPVNLRKKNPMHFGVANLEYKDNKLTGTYWTDREINGGKNTRGTMELQRTNKNGHFDLISILDVFDVF